MLKIQFTGLLLVLAMISTDTVTMKRSRDQYEYTQIEDRNLISLPDEIQLRILSSSHPSDLILACKKWCNIFKFKNWKFIVQQLPSMITRSSLDCQRIYYYLMQQNNPKDLTSFSAEDTNYKSNLYQLHRELDGITIDRPFEEQFNKLSDPSQIIETCRQRHISYFSDNKSLSPKQSFVNNILNNNLDEMRTFIQNTSDETLAKVLQSKKIALAKWGSLAMFEILAPKLSLNISYPEAGYDYEGSALDAILVNITEDPNRRARYDIIEFLLKQGANPNINEGGNTLNGAIARAHEKNDYKLLKLLFTYGLNVNAEENADRLIDDSQSAIVFAINKNNSQLVHILLSMNANPHTGITSTSDTPFDLLDIAQKKGNQEIINAIEVARIRWTLKISADTHDCQS